MLGSIGVLQGSRLVRLCAKTKATMLRDKLQLRPSESEIYG